MKKLNLISALTVILPLVTGIPVMASAQAATQRGTISKPIDQLMFFIFGNKVSNVKRHTQNTINYCYNIVTDLKYVLYQQELK